MSPSSPYIVMLIAMILGVLASVARGAECEDRTALDECLKRSPPLPQGPGIPGTDEEVTAACRSFKARIGCFEEYVVGCGDAGAREALHAQSAGAKRALHRLCDDSGFRQEYLKHAPCYREVSSAWEACRSQFLSSTPSPDCCARQRFLECVREEGERRCSTEGASLLRQIAAMLTDATAYRAPCAPDACANYNAAARLRPLAGPLTAAAVAAAIGLTARRVARLTCP